MSNELSKYGACLMKELGGECEGNLTDHLLFVGQLKTPTCDKHYKSHLVIMFLHKQDIKVEELLTMSDENRTDKINEISIKLGKSVEELLEEAQKYE